MQPGLKLSTCSLGQHCGGSEQTAPFSRHHVRSNASTYACMKQLTGGAITYSSTLRQLGTKLRISNVP